MELALTVPSASTLTNVLLAQLSAIPPLLAPKNAEGSPSIISSLQLLPQTVYLAVLLCLQAFIPTQVNHIALITSFTLPLVRCLVHNQFPIIIGLSQQYYHQLLMIYITNQSQQLMLSCTHSSLHPTSLHQTINHSTIVIIVMMDTRRQVTYI